MPKTNLDAEQRKLAWQACREKQRVANILRAGKTYKARIADNSLATPPKPDTKTHYYIGCSGWFYWDWRGIFYPQNSSTADWFRIMPASLKP